MQAEGAGMVEERSFYYWEMLVGLPLFVGVGLVVAVSAIRDANARPIGIAAALFVVILVRFSARTTYRATVYADGSMLFKAMTRSVTTTVSAISRIGAISRGRGGVTWVFEFAGGNGQLGGMSGKALARYVIERNPAVDYPTRRFGAVTSQMYPPVADDSTDRT